MADLRQVGQDGVDLRHEAHVEHVVGFVEHQLFDLVEAHGAALEMVEEAPGRGDDDARLLRQLVHLMLDVEAADERDGAQPVAGAEVVEEGLRLQRDFARGREDEPTDAAAGLNALGERNREGGGLAGAGLGEAEDVTPGDRSFDDGGLDRRRMCPAELTDGEPQLGRHTQIVEGAGGLGNGMLRKEGFLHSAPFYSGSGKSSFWGVPDPSSRKFDRPTPARRKRVDSPSVKRSSRAYGDPGELLGFGRRRGERPAAAQRAEVPGLELHRDRAPVATAPAGGLVDLAGQAFEGRGQRRDRQVVLERRLRGDRLDRPFGDHRVVVDPPRELVQAAPELPEAHLELDQRARPEVSDRRHPHRGESGAGGLADTGELADRQRGEERLDLLRPDDEQAVGLLPVGGDLGEELVRRDAGRGGEGGLFADLAPDDARRLGRGREAGELLGDVEVGLVERQRLDERRVAKEDRPHPPRHLLVAREVGRHEDRLRTLALRGDRRHRRADPEPPRLVRRRADHRPRPRPGDHDRLPPELRPVPLLDRSVEGVHVDVDDLPHEAQI